MINPELSKLIDFDAAKKARSPEPVWKQILRDIRTNPGGVVFGVVLAGVLRLTNPKRFYPTCEAANFTGGDFKGLRIVPRN